MPGKWQHHKRADISIPLVIKPRQSLMMTSIPAPFVSSMMVAFAHAWQPVAIHLDKIVKAGVMARQGCPANLRLQLSTVMVARDGVMDPAGPKPCAAMRGTTILVEDLFYNSLTRKKARLACVCQMELGQYGRFPGLIRTC